MTTPTRDQLQQSYQTAEGLYEWAFALVTVLQAWTRPGVQQEMPPDALADIQHKILGAWRDVERLSRLLMAQDAHISMEFYDGEHPSQVIVEGTPDDPGCIIARVFEHPEFVGDPQDDAALDNPECWAPSAWALRCLSGFIDTGAQRGEIVMAGDIQVDGIVYRRAILVQFPTEEATRAAFQDSHNGRGFMITFPRLDEVTP